MEASRKARTWCSQYLALRIDKAPTEESRTTDSLSSPPPRASPPRVQPKHTHISFVRSFESNKTTIQQKMPVQFNPKTPHAQLWWRSRRRS